jgi:hypothetical protein
MSTVIQQPAVSVAPRHAGAAIPRRRFHVRARLRVAFTKIRYNKLARTLAVWITAALIAVFYGWLAASGF